MMGGVVSKRKSGSTMSVRRHRNCKTIFRCVACWRNNRNSYPVVTLLTERLTVSVWPAANEMGDAELKSDAA